MALGEGSGYSVWMMPNKEASERIREIIDDIASKNKTIAFEPHITLIGSVHGEGLWETTQELAARMKPIPITFESMGQTDSYFRCIFAKVVKNKQLESAYDDAVALFKAKRTDFMPHISLMYADIEEKKRLEIIERVDTEIFRKLDGFLIDRICLYSTDGPVTKWYKVGDMALPA